METEKELRKSCPQHREEQQISVPYLWEEEPGKTKQWWSYPAIPEISIPSPVKLVVSIPFEWEDKPGIPIQRMETVPDCLTSSKPGLDALPAMPKKALGHTLTKRTLTLGELMQLSRQLSCRLKQIDAKKRIHPKEYLKKSLLTCLPFIAYGNKSNAYISSW